MNASINGCDAMQCGENGTVLCGNEADQDSVGAVLLLCRALLSCAVL